MAPSPILIALTGGSCAGKTTLARLIRKMLPPGETAVISTDRYYRPLDHLPPGRRHLENFDSPEMLDRDRLREHLGLLKRGNPVELPVYDFRLHTRSAEIELLRPLPVVLVEGIFLLVDPDLRLFFDLTVYVDTPEEVRLGRRIRRDSEERGRSEEEVRKRYLVQVRPAHRKLVRPGRELADLVVSGERGLEIAARSVAERIGRIASGDVAPGPAAESTR